MGEQGFNVGYASDGTDGGVLQIAGNNIAALATWSNIVSSPNPSQQTIGLSLRTAGPLVAGQTVIPIAGGVTTDWINGTLTTPASAFSTPGPPPGAGATIIGVDPVANTITIAGPGVLASTPGPTQLGGVYAPADISASSWQGLDAAVATLKAAMDKPTGIGQTLGNHINMLTGLQTFLSAQSDALAEGAGAVIDANIPKVAAALVAAEIRQQLATQSLSLSNQAPQLLLQLFK